MGCQPRRRNKITTMEKNIIVANWKMNLGIQETEILAKDILGGLKKIKKLDKIDAVLCPSFVALSVVKNRLSKTYGLKTKISLGAQDCFWEERGSYTGEISPLSLKEAGCKYVIIGHSERREHLQEKGWMIHRKIKLALEAGLTPILCVGETFDERRVGAKDYVIIEQVSEALEGIDLRPHQQLVIAHEPVWVIGSGQTVSPEEAEYVNQVILQRVRDLYPPPIIRNNIRIIYGGSVDSDNIQNFLGQETIDGFLIGGASLKADEFVKMCQKLT